MERNPGSGLRGGWRWWSVRVLVRCTCADPAGDGDLWDHSMLILKARSEIEAKRRGAIAARRHDTEYIGGTGYRVRWRFDGVLEAYDTGEDALRGGMEVHSRFGRGKGKERPGDPLDDWPASRRFERELLGGRGQDEPRLRAGGAARGGDPRSPEAPRS